MDYMKKQVLASVKQDLLKRAQTASRNRDLVLGIISGCFEIADRAAAERNEIRSDATISGPERKARLDAVATGASAQSLDQLLQPFARVRDYVDTAWRNCRPGMGLSKEDASAYEDVGLVNSAVYFAKRELEGR